MFICNTYKKNLNIRLKKILYSNSSLRNDLKNFHYNLKHLVVLLQNETS